MFNGNDSAWIDLIDQEFPGDGLTEQDIPFISDFIPQQLAKDREVWAFIVNRTQEMKTFLAKQGVTVLSQDQQSAIGYLVALSSADYGQNLETSMRATLEENARLFLISAGLLNDAWRGLIDTFL